MTDSLVGSALLILHTLFRRSHVKKKRQKRRVSIFSNLIFDSMTATDTPQEDLEDLDDDERSSSSEIIIAI